MNMEYAVLKRALPSLFPLRSRSQFWLLFTKATEGDEPEDLEWVGLIRSIKQNFRTQINKTTKKLEKKIDTVADKISILVENMEVKKKE